MQLTKKIQVPSWLTTVFAAALAVVGGLNVATFGLSAPWGQLVTFGCAAAAGIAVAPLTHGALRNVLHLSFPTALSIAGAATTACAGITTLSGVSPTLKGIFVGILTGIAGVLVGPESGPEPTPVPPVPPTPAPVPTPAPTPTPVSKATKTRPTNQK